MCVKTAYANWIKVKFYDINSRHRDPQGYQNIIVVFENYSQDIILAQIQQAMFGSNWQQIGFGSNIPETHHGNQYRDDNHFLNLYYINFLN